MEMASKGHFFTHMPQPSRKNEQQIQITISDKMLREKIENTTALKAYQYKEVH